MVNYATIARQKQQIRDALGPVVRSEANPSGAEVYYEVGSDEPWVIRDEGWFELHQTFTEALQCAKQWKESYLRTTAVA